MLSLPSNSFNHPSFTSFSLSSLSHIKYFSVGANSFSHVSSWELSDLPSLRQLIVSSRVCAEEEGRFAVTNCDTLASIHIEDESFTLFSECTLQNLPMLQELSIGADDTREACFARVEKVVLDSLPSLHTLQIYCNAFQMLVNTDFIVRVCELNESLDLPSLETVLLRPTESGEYEEASCLCLRSKCE